MSNTNDLTQGGILKKLLLVAIPIMGTQLMQMVYNLTDIAWLGQMGAGAAATAVSASGLAGMYLWLSAAPMMIARMGSEIGVSQSIGAGDPVAARGYAEASSRIGLILGIAFGAAMMLFPSQLISVLGAQEGELHRAASSYLMITAIGIPFTYLSAAITGAFNGAGNSRLGFLANCAGLVVNMVLDPVFIFGCGWGVEGAAVATVLGQITVCVLFVALVKRHRARPFEQFRLLGGIRRAVLGQIMKWSLPVALESGLFTMLSMVVTAMVTPYGQNALATQRVGSNIESLSWLIGGGFSSAVTAFMGQNYGAGKWKRIRRGYRISLMGLLGWEVLVTVLLIFGGRALFALFMPNEPDTWNMGQTYLRILSICQVFMALEGACAGTFRGIGKTVPPSVISIVSNLVRPPLCYLLGQAMGLYGIWLGIALSASLRGLADLICFTVYERTLPHEDAPALMSAS